MSTQNQNDVTFIAQRLTELCREGKYFEAQDELFSRDAVSMEPEYTQQPVAEGIDAIREKGKEFQESIAENHGGYVNEPVIAGNHFAIAMGVDVTQKDGQRMKMDEICVYKVEGGKIVSEQFFY